MKSLKCLLGFHDFYAIYYGDYSPLIVMVKNLRWSNPPQHVTMNQICIHCKKRERYLIKIPENLKDWDVVAKEVLN